MRSAREYNYSSVVNFKHTDIDRVLAKATDDTHGFIP